jgi:hypothetical protein
MEQHEKAWNATAWKSMNDNYDNIKLHQIDGHISQIVMMFLNLDEPPDMKEHKPSQNADSNQFL